MCFLQIFTVIILNSVEKYICFTRYASNIVYINLDMISRHRNDNFSSRYIEKNHSMFFIIQFQ